MMNARGICVAGNLIVDKAYTLSGWPGKGELSTILDEGPKSLGGLCCNVAIGLSMLDGRLPIRAAGVIGDDHDGRLIREAFRQHPNILVDEIAIRGKTSYTLVMNDALSKERTFLQFRGSNASFCEEDVNWALAPCRMMHIGYIMLLDALDAEDELYGTKLARLLCRAQSLGIKTSVDVVSEAGNRYHALIPPALKYANYCTINETEAQQATGIPLRDGCGALIPGNMPAALRYLRRLGVADWAVIHAPEGGFGLDGDGKYIALPSLRLPEGYIHSTTGAGDAFCSGLLYGAHEGFTLREAMRLGIATASCSLNRPDTTSGIPDWQRALAFYEEMGGQK